MKFEIVKLVDEKTGEDVYLNIQNIKRMYHQPGEFGYELFFESNYGEVYKSKSYYIENLNTANKMLSRVEYQLKEFKNVQTVYGYLYIKKENIMKFISEANQKGEFIEKTSERAQQIKEKFKNR